MRFLFLLLFGLSCIGNAQTLISDANNDTRVKNQILLQLLPETNMDEFLLRCNELLPTGTNLRLEKILASDWHIYLLVFNETNCDPARLKNLLLRVPEVGAVQWNHFVEERSKTPNDPEWFRQSDMSLIGAPEAWDYTPGGLMSSRGLANADTIVVAVLEKGALMSHPDLAPNRWFNRREIPNNGVDDDGNGYKDDYGGWNPKRQNDSLGTRGTHGTSVNGIIGAKGNNTIGVSGVNWNVKLMNISDIVLESEIIEGYYYAGNMRKRYNQSNGLDGAFVVSTNASFGINKAKAEDFPLWCAVYDSLGRQGIISVAATANVNRDVDAEGDMPTTCTSEFLIAVTNTDVFGNKVVSAGFGLNSIDMGAPGDGSYTTESTPDFTPSYGEFGGTSAACPHVTGAVALLYGLGCPSFTNDALTNPTACGRRVRDILLENTEADPSLADRSTTGGYLSLKNAIQAIFKLCEGSVGPLKFVETRNFSDQDRFLVYYQTPNFLEYSFRIHNTLGQLMFETTLNPKEFQENYVEFSTYWFSKGVYTMTLSRGKAKVSQKFVKI